MARWREVVVPESAAGMRLDRFLAARFPDRSRSFFGARIRAGEVADERGTVLAASHRLVAAQRLRITIDGMAPSGPPPGFPPILWQGDDLVVVDKPAGMLCHPAGTTFQWGVVSLAKERWPSERVDLVHRLDRDTSGTLLLTRSLERNRELKAAMKAGRVGKTYQALVRGRIPWDQQVVEAPIGAAEGPIRIQMAVRSDGLAARTDVEVLARKANMSWVRCTLHTGRTHQIRVHLDHLGFSLVGDRMYGVPPDLFLDIWENGVSEAALARAGAPRHALHAASLRFDTPTHGPVTVRAPFPDDLRALWDSTPD